MISWVEICQFVGRCLPELLWECFNTRVEGFSVAQERKCCLNKHLHMALGYHPHSFSQTNGGVLATADDVMEAVVILQTPASQQRFTVATITD